MATVRKPFQGILNIIRFNWHFYVIAFIVIMCLEVLSGFFNAYLFFLIQFVSGIIILSIGSSLFVSYYVYDLSRLYELDWIKSNDEPLKILNINAGFDETTDLLSFKFKNSEVLSYDFYDPEKHTEVSIKRARKAYPPSIDTVKFEASNLELKTASIDKVFLILSAHEIRNDNEKIIFLKAIKSVLKPNGEITVVEHLRDVPNFMAYNIGAFHFFSKSTWLNVFKSSGLTLVDERKHTSFISIFKLE
jgi:ubiquinone/menaquinone biosynthesis C-methylase UbiE